MNYMTMRIATFCSGIVLATTTLLAQAQASQPNILHLPPEIAQLKISALPGYMTAMQKCATCHSADYIQYQPPGMTLGQWTGEVGKMAHLYGAPISEDDIKKVGAYLAVAYGSAKESELPAELKVAVQAPSGSGISTSLASQPSGSGKNIDINALLAENNCLSCHALDKKIVGPAYHDVALKYQHDPQAISKLETSIRTGGSGKWGPIPMPPFTQLTTQEIRALAEFVLKQ